MGTGCPIDGERNNMGVLMKSMKPFHSAWVDRTAPKVKKMFICDAETKRPNPTLGLHVR